MQNENKRRCFRCNGQKKIFKIGSAYSLKNTGGIEVTCPLCNGDGHIPTIQEVEKEVKKEEQQLSKSQQKRLSSQRRNKRTKEETQNGQAESRY